MNIGSTPTNCGDAIRWDDSIDCRSWCLRSRNSKVAGPRERRDFAWTLRLWVRRGSERKHAVGSDLQQRCVSPQPPENHL